MSAEFDAVSLHQALADLPIPDGYYAGREGVFRSPPHNILVFARSTSEQAMDGGLHLHPRFVFCWCIDTAGDITVDGRMLVLSPGQGLLLFPFQQHYFSSFRSPGILWAFVSFDLAEHPFLEPLRSRVVGIRDREQGRLGHIVRSFQNGDGSIAAQLELFLHGLAGQVDAGLNDMGANAPDQRIRDVVQFVYAHLDHGLAVEDVAGAVHVSASHLRRLFRDRMGISLGRFMLQARLNHAQSLLHTSDLPVGRVAEACGFSSVYAFSRAFRNEKGMAPSAVRKGER